MSDTTPTVFISYSHKDEEWKERLVTQLGVLARQEMLEVWDDRRIQAGADWQKEIGGAIARSKVAVLLVSAHSLTSPFILNDELVRLLSRHKDEGLPVLPIIWRPCAWQAIDWLSRLQARPKDGRPLSAGSDYQIDSDLAAIALEIRELLSPAQRPVETPRAVPRELPMNPVTAARPRRRWPMPMPLHQELLETMTVRDIPYSDDIVLLINRSDWAEILRRSSEAYQGYLEMKQELVNTLKPVEHYLIARYLFEAIRRDDFEACRRRPFVYPVHLYLSGMIRQASETEHAGQIAVLRRWLMGKRSVYSTSRDFAAFELGMCQAQAAAADLLACVRDSNELEMVRYYGAMALGMIGDSSIVDELGLLAAEENSERFRTVLLHVVYFLQSRQ